MEPCNYTLKIISSVMDQITITEMESKTVVLNACWDYSSGWVCLSESISKASEVKYIREVLKIIVTQAESQISDGM